MSMRQVQLDFGAALVAHLLLWLDLPPIVQAGAIFVLTVLLPGLLLARCLTASAPPLDRPTYLVYALGSGYAVALLLTLLISYLPGAVPGWGLLFAFDGLSLGLGWWLYRRLPRHATQSASAPSTRFIVGLTAIVIFAGLLRLLNLGYAEFLTDEARVILRAVAVSQGNEDVLFLHRKGPAEILLPALHVGIAGTIDEAAARLPFALANLTGLAALGLLGWRLSGSVGGISAALLLALNGYLIGFARFVQFQSLVFLFTVLVVLILAEQWRVGRILPGRFALAGLFSGAALLAHYDGGSMVVPALILAVWLGWRSREWRGWLRHLLLAGAVALATVLLFYGRFLLHPNFQATYSYLVDQRLVADRPFPFNNLADFYARSSVYNTSIYLWLLIALSLVGLVLTLRRGWGGRLGTPLGIALALLIGYSCWQPTWLHFSGRDLILLPFVAALLLIGVAPRLELGERISWLWFGSLLIATLFLMAYPRTHVYIFLAPWALVCGGVVATIATRLQQTFGERPAQWMGAGATAALILLVGGHSYWYFAHAEAEALRTGEMPPPLANQPERPTIDALYGFPLANGWKTVGALYEAGIIRGPYETNQRDDLVSGWYTHLQPRCATSAQWYFAVNTVEFWSSHRQPSAESLAVDGYHPWGIVTVDQQPRMTIYARGVEPPSTPQQFALETFAAHFDQFAPTNLALTYPVVEPPIPNPIHANLGDQVWLEGYEIHYAEPLLPGDSFTLTLYWRAQRGGLPAYKVFNQAFYGDGVMVAQQDSIPVCNRRPTTGWYPGELIVDQYTIPVAADAPPGAYPLRTGLYEETNFARLPLLDATGQIIADHVQLADLPISVR